ncbi:MAG TPA: hypothetical protein ENK28_04650 [Aliiroseovarius sp.]|nr:hypothetical protein [Aliiroseovarius sp.]
MIIYPLSLADFMDLLNVREQIITLETPVSQAVTSAGAVAGVSSVAPRWSVVFKMAPVSQAGGSEIIARMRAIAPAHARFLVAPIYNSRPKSDPGGTVSGSSVTVSSTGAEKVTLALAGLPAAYDLSVGDYMSVTVGTVPHFHQIVEAATANGSGVTPEFSIVPPLSASVVAGQAVTLVNPTMLASAIPGSVREGVLTMDQLMSGASFTARSELS